jgi:hypothetical protein
MSGQALPKDAKPITTWLNRDEVWLDVIEGIQKAVEELWAERQERAVKERYESAAQEQHAEQRTTAEELSGDAHDSPLKCLPPILRYEDRVHRRTLT